MDIKEKILQVMRARAKQEYETFEKKYPLTMATWNIRCAMEKAFPNDEWSSKELRKVLTELAKDGVVTKDEYHSRIGQAVWRLED